MSSKNQKPKLIIILGPTASGKTGLALELAEKYNGEIVNADSRQIYREMDIGTGSPTNCHSEFISESTKNTGLIIPTSSKLSATEIGMNCGCKQKILKQVQNDDIIIINNIPHYLFHIINPNQKFSLSQYKKLAVKKIKDIQKRNKIPFLVGGTGLYISSVVNNLEIPKAPPDDKIRKRLEKISSEELFEKLKKIDLKSAEIIGENNKRKLIRALEVYEITGKLFSTQQTKGKPLFETLQIGIKIDRKELYKKIDQRVDKMIEMGLVEEIKNLAKKYSFDLPALSGIGYQEIGLYLQNKTTLEEAVQKMKFRTHQYARRQMTWFQRDERIRWIKNYEEAEELVEKFL